MTSQATLCEVTYDDWNVIKESLENRELHTPFRLSRSANCRRSLSLNWRPGEPSPKPYSGISDSLSLPPSYEYLRCLDDNEGTQILFPGNPLPTRSYDASEYKYPYYSTPGEGDDSVFGTIPRQRHGMIYEDSASDVSELALDDSLGPLKWVDSLNKWVEEDEFSKTRPYLSFVNTAPTVEKATTGKEQNPELRDLKVHLPCERYEHHMNQFSPEKLAAERKERANRKQFEEIMALQRREAIRKKNEELKSQKRQRKAYSTPAYTSMEARRAKVRFKVTRSETSSPVEDKREREHRKDVPPKVTFSSHKENIPATPKVAIKPKPPPPPPTQPPVSSLKPEPSKHVVTDMAKKEEKKVQITEPDNVIRKNKTAPITVRLKEDKGGRKKRKKKKNKGTDDTTGSIHKEKAPPPEALTVSKAEDALTDSDENEKKKSIREVRKKEKIVTERVKTRSPTPPPVVPDDDVRKTGDWIYGEEDEEEGGSDKPQKEAPELPTLADAPPPLPSTVNVTSSRRESVSPTKGKNWKNTISLSPLQLMEQKRRWGPKKIDTSFSDEREREMLAERRRKKQQAMYEKLKHRRKSNGLDDAAADEASFHDYSFLTQYCIFENENRDMYRHTFDTFDEAKQGWLTGEETMIALRGINGKLNIKEEEYLFRVIEMTGYNIANGADFKLFSVLAALSLRITALDHWMRNIIGNIDFKMLEMKLFMCKTLWECNVDPEINKIPLDQLCVDLRAGGVSLQHEREVRHKLGHLCTLDLLDFLTYIPLFIMIHESILDNPLSDTRVK